MRNNQDLFESFKPEDAEAVAGSKLAFVTPTVIVDLPSKGKFYPEGHPLRGKETVEIREMTAKEEDILFNKSFIDKGIVLDRLLESVLVEKLKASDFLVIDKNAVLVATRIGGYGPLYPITVDCEECGTEITKEVDLNDLLKIKEVSLPEGASLDSDLVSVILPKTKWAVTLRPISGKLQEVYQKTLDMKRKNKLPENTVIETLKSFIYSINGETSELAVYTAINSLPAVDSKYIRNVYPNCFPNLNTATEVECGVCDHKQEVEVPFNANFFWSD